MDTGTEQAEINKGKGGKRRKKKNGTGRRALRKTT